MQNIIALTYSFTDLQGAKISIRIDDQLHIVQGFNDMFLFKSVIQSFAFLYLGFSLIHVFQIKCHFFISSLPTHKHITSLFSHLIYSMWEGNVSHAVKAS